MSTKILVILASSFEPLQIENDIKNNYDSKCLKFRGVPKGLLVVSGKPVLTWLYESLRQHFSQIFIVANAYNFKYYERWASSAQFPRKNILNKGLGSGTLEDLEFVHRVKKINQDTIITFPYVLWDEFKIDQNIKNFVLTTLDNVDIAYGLSKEALENLENHSLDLAAYTRAQENSRLLKVEKGTLFDFADPSLTLTQFLEHWEHRIVQDDAGQEEPIQQRSYARVGLVGNPSDGFSGKTMSLLISNFWADVTLIPNKTGETITIEPNALSDSRSFPSIACLAEVSEIDGYETGDKLIQACCNVFFRYCQSQSIPIRTEQGFRVVFETNIPRQVGLAGSSAIITALWRALCCFYNVGDQIRLEIQANLVLKVEQEELKISAGLQDRVIQAFGGLMYMDFDKKYVKEHGYGKYERLDVSLLPELWLAYIADPDDSGKVHSTVKERFLKGDAEVVEAMETFALYTKQAKEALESKDHDKFAQLMTSNFNLRRKLYGDRVVGASNLRMIELARSHDCVAKFSGSGGAVVVMWHGQDKNKKRLDLLKLKRALENEGCVFLRLSAKE